MLGSLEIYKEMKDLRRYYVERIHGHLRADLKHSVGVQLLNQLFSSVRHLAVISETRNTEKKLAAAEDFLCEYEELLDKFEFLVDVKSISYDQGAVIFEMVIKIEKMMGGIRKSILRELSESPIQGERSEQSV